MKRKPPWLVSFVCIVFVVGCSSSKTLTRSRAKQIIEQSAAFQNRSDWLPFNKSGQQCCALTPDIQLGVQEGYWKLNYLSGYPELTEKGSRYFSSISWPGGGDGWGAQPAMKLHKQIAEVTGMESGNGGTSMRVEFEWVSDTSSFPPEVKKFLRADQGTQKGNNVLTLYDDGWRVDDRW